MKQLPSSIFRLLYHAKRACSFLHRYFTCLQLQQKDLFILPRTPHPPLQPLGPRITTNVVPGGTREGQAVPCLVLGQLKRRLESSACSTGVPCWVLTDRSRLTQPPRAQSSALIAAAAGEKRGRSVCPCPFVCARLSLPECRRPWDRGGSSEQAGAWPGCGGGQPPRQEVCVAGTAR